MHTSTVWERNAAFPVGSVTLCRPAQSIREEVVLHRGFMERSSCVKNQARPTNPMCIRGNRLELLLHPLTFTFSQEQEQIVKGCQVTELLTSFQVKISVIRKKNHLTDGSFPIKKHHFTCPASTYSVYIQYAYATETRAPDAGELMHSNTTLHTSQNPEAETAKNVEPDQSTNSWQHGKSNTMLSNRLLCCNIRPEILYRKSSCADPGV